MRDMVIEISPADLDAVWRPWLKKWRDEHDGEMPSSFKLRKEARDLLTPTISCGESDPRVALNVAVIALRNPEGALRKRVEETARV